MPRLDEFFSLLRNERLEAFNHPPRDTTHIVNGSRRYQNNIQSYAYLIPMISLRLNQYFSEFCNLKKQTKNKTKANI